MVATNHTKESNQNPTFDLASINHDNPMEKTPLINAILDSNIPQITSLLDHGADINTLHFAEIDNPMIMRKRVDAAISRHPLDFATRISSTEIFKLLLDRGASLAHANPMHVIVGTQSSRSNAEKIEWLEYLLDTVGLDINAIEFAHDAETMEQFKRIREEKGELYGSRALGTPLHKAASGGYFEVVEYLLKKGAKRDALDTEGWTALEWAKKNDVEDGNFSQRVLDVLSL